MFKIKELYIKGFKDPNREITIKFSDSPVTIIYGENGSGKTTLLKVIQAIFKLDFEFLKSQNISIAKVVYQLNQEEQQIEIVTEKESFLTTNEENFNQLNSVLFGIHRGLVDANKEFIENFSKSFKENVKQLERFLITSMPERMPNAKLREGLFLIGKLEQSVKALVDKTNNTFELITDNHSSVDNFYIQDVDLLLRTSFNKGSETVITNISNAFFSTIDSAINGVPDITLSADFQQRFNDKKNFFKSFIEKQANSTTKQKLQEFLANDQQELNKEQPLFKALLKNMLEAAEKDEKENIDLKAITTLVSTFNEFVIDKKKLVLNAVEAYISFPNGQRHPLSDLSSGERHLLSFLTLFLIVARDRNFFLIDEPEISLSMKWQRRLLELLSEFSPNSQIIVATHSPSIANRNYTNQVELI
jgi:predicted ATPase